MAIETYYPHGEVEPKWQAAWTEQDVYDTPDDNGKPRYYVLEQFPYPSGNLHMGHVRVYTIGDAIARFRRMRGYNVLHPMGWDAFGLPAENAAIKHQTHPRIWTEQCIDRMKGQMQRLGLSYDWKRELATCKPDYYRWNQWMFIQMWKNGMVERREAAVNWCPKCNTVLANEQVINGRCWRHEDTEVDVRPLKQWFLAITKYAEELNADLDEKLQAWPNLVTAQQRNWIGRSTGAEVVFTVKETGEQLPIFTTRPDTLYGVTFMSIAPEHPKIMEWIKGRPDEAKIKSFINECVHAGREARTDEGAEKKGMPLGLHAINPVNGREVPIFIANFVLMEYGTGAVMAVPAHDQRDFEFARKYDIPVQVVIQPAGEQLDPATMTAAYTEPGTMDNSGPFNGQPSTECKSGVIRLAEEKGFGSARVQFRLRDWLISRQRFWGTPIPFLYDENGELHPVPDDQLPVTLPENVKFTGEGNPLLGCDEWLNYTCPKTGKKFRRETDTMDTFFDSSWYYLRFCDALNNKLPFDKQRVGGFMPVDIYVGGKEHAILHLLYSRFFTKVLRDLGLADLDEPFARLLTQGMVLKEAKDPKTGEMRFLKMSKSVGNVVDPNQLVEERGADAARLFILFASPPDRDLPWSEESVEGMSRFINRIWRFAQEHAGTLAAGVTAGPEVAVGEVSEKADKDLLRQIHDSTRRVTEDLEERFSFNTAIAACMELLNATSSYKPREGDALSQRLVAFAMRRLTLLLSPFAPHLAEEAWSRLGGEGLASAQSWPEFDKAALAVDEVEIVVQIMGKIRGRMMIDPADDENAVLAKAKASSDVMALLEGKKIMKIIYVKDKLLNFVAK